MQRVLACILVVFLGTATLPAAPGPNPRPKATSVGSTQIGKASWYGKQFHGRTTASGEEYNMFYFTAAHRSLPLGTWIKVTNLKNSKWVVVRVNDRGPYAGNRILDLSYAAAQSLGFRAKGIQKVKIEVVDLDEFARNGDLRDTD
jgi:rare lipoprotein A